ncbi:MAG: A/G-specific adenine glycosylase [Bacteroidales bacterium]|nr:A/G-specific adenine glycosylase [Bacteroidales bacterium]
MNKRTLPWRGSHDPYLIWISEIIFQQTRIKQGISYYRRFITRFPDLSSLARADEREVLKLWEGLGYYARARNLHETARYLWVQRRGKFPETFAGIRALKGIGDYTAACIASICYGLPYAAVDGNVYRVVSRLYADSTPIDTGAGKRHYRQLAQALLDPVNPGDFNEAMMDLGATCCTRANPACLLCPLQRFCLAHRNRSEINFPVKSRKLNRKKRFFHYFFILTDDQIWLHKRTGNDIWRGLYELPLLESAGPEFFSPAIRDPKLVYTQIHRLTHQDIRIRYYRPIEWTADPDFFDDEIIRVPVARLPEFPLPQPLKQFISGRLAELTG